MKIMKKLLGFVLMFAAVVMVSNTKSFAAVQYTDNVIPVMTSNTSPGGVASASSERGLSTAAYKAFDGEYLYPKMWACLETTGWLAYEFDTPRTIVKYTIQNHISKASWKAFPKDWNFEGWNGNEWVVLDTQTNITWTNEEKKEFTFNNPNPYKKYRLNILANSGATTSTWKLIVNELQMMELATPQVTAPTNLVATGGDKIVDLTWDAVQNAQSYNIKRLDPATGIYNIIQTVTGSALSYTDGGLTNGTKYTYIVTAIVSGVESANSNEASAIPTAPPIPGDSDFQGNKAKLLITMVTGEIKEYDLAIDKINAFIDWYDTRYDGTGKNYYVISKESIPYLSRKEYIVFDKISSFEIMDYNE